MILLLLAFSWEAVAQQFPYTTSYLVNPYALSPTFAGYSGHPEVFINYRKDWTQINGSPQTIRANGFGPVHEDVMWVGGELLMDRMDIASTFKANLSFTYKLQVENEQFVYFGLWGSFYQRSINLNDAVGIDPNDPVFSDPSKLNSVAGNAGVGIHYNYRRWVIGAAFPSLFGSKDEYENTGAYKFKVQREFMLYATNIFKLNTNWDLQAFAVYRKTVNEPYNLELSAMAIYQERFCGGLLFRNGGVLAINVGGLIYKGLFFNYSYEIGMGGINNQSGGSHEITLGYRFKFFGNRFFGESGTANSRYGKSKKSRNVPYPEVEDYYMRGGNR